VPPVHRGPDAVDVAKVTVAASAHASAPVRASTGVSLLAVSDALEETATATPRGEGGRSLREGETFDHYVVERELGRGGMGVVYCALDTDLQRRVALKVLRDGLAPEAQQRLLREARAMARLSHPNVVTVYEVGSVRGQDFVAMELVDGEPVADWLRTGKRTRPEIVAAFIAAGRGLAAAHAAGIVHRDFKPHNILRSRAGRIVVTDFGLAREATDPLATTMPIAVSTASASGSIGDGALTVPGELLGTPAYMAPEQWLGGAVTPATDQFAYCVALWEALAGERPYRGQTIEALREQVMGGPTALDDSKLPRSLRAVLRRGLAPDPSARWPSMEALLARVEARSRRVALVAIAGAAVVTLGVIVAMTRTSAQPSCRAPAVDPRTVTADSLDAWHAQRALACAAPSGQREARLDCLDRLLARIDAISRAARLGTTLSTPHALDHLSVAPVVCERPPALPASYSDAAVATFALYAGGTLAPDVVDRTRAAADSDPCVALYLALSDARLDDADRATRQCGDDIARVELALRTFARDAEGSRDEELGRRARELQAELALHGKQDRVWQIDATRAAVYRKRRRHDEAITYYDAAISGASQLEATSLAARKLETLLERGGSADMALLRSEVARWRSLARDQQDEATVERLEWLDATAQWMQGEMAAAQPRLHELHQKRPPVVPAATRVAGIVVDARGKPVAGATVVAGYAMMGDRTSIATPLWSPGDLLRLFETTTSDAEGKFVLEHAPACYGVMLAQHGRERSRPISSQDHARLMLQSTTRIRGRVDLGGRVGNFVVSVAPWSSVGAASVLAASVNAAVAPDGSFEVDGVLAGDAMIGVGEAGRVLHGHSAMRRAKIGQRGLDDVSLELPSGREVRVLLRDATFAGAPVFAISGTFRGKTMGELFRSVQLQLAITDAAPVVGAPPPAIAPSYREGDLLATFTSAPTGPATVCALQRLPGCGTDIPIRCKPLPANAALVTLSN
jgi:predicted Ser/Thr protein kinase